MEQSVRKQVWKRTIHFWGYQVERMFLIMIVMSAIYSLLGTKYKLDGEESFTLTMFMYMAIVGTVVILMLQMGYASTHVPLILSMGASRRETLMGVQFSNLLYFVQMMILMGVGLVVFPIIDGKWNSLFICIWLIIAIVYFAATAIGQFGAWLHMRYGMKGSIIYSVLFVVLLLVVGGVVALIAGRAWNGGVEAVLTWESMKNELTVVCVVALVIGIVVYIAGYQLLKKAIMNYEVYR